MTVKRIAVLFAAVCALAFLGASATAQKSVKGAKGAGKGKASGASMYKKADTNGDGKLSLAEWTKMQEEVFKKADTNSDGYLDEAELKAMRLAQAKGAEKGAKPARSAGGGGEEGF